MKTLARVTGAIFIIIGAIVLVVGLFFLTRGVVNPQPLAPSLFGAAELASLPAPLRLLTGGLVSMQGMMLAAVGEGLWLLATIAENTEKKS